MRMNVDRAYRLAVERYQEYGGDAEAALARLKTIPVSLHCWQGDDIRGFEQFGGELGGGLAATGKAKTLRFGALWDHYCESSGVPGGEVWLTDVRQYERDVLSRRTAETHWDAALAR